MALTNSLLIAQVTHAREHPRRHAFRYGVYYLCFALSDLPRLTNRLLSHNRWNLFSFHDRDHAKGAEPQAWIGKILSEWNLPQADGEVVLLTLPRLFGYVFNPVSFWFCLDREGRLRAVLSEVCNTFGERHCYLSFHEDRRVIEADDWLRAEKIFHVSPFMEVKGHYRFRFAYGQDKIGVWINYHDGEKLLLATAVTGKRSTLGAIQLLACFFRYPLITFKVIGLIHFEAVRLWLKGARYHSKPTPPLTEISQ